MTMNIWIDSWYRGFEEQLNKLLPAMREGEDWQTSAFLTVTAAQQVARGCKEVLGLDHPAVQHFWDAVGHTLIHFRDTVTHYDTWVIGTGRGQHPGSTVLQSGAVLQANGQFATAIICMHQQRKGKDGTILKLDLVDLERECRRLRAALDQAEVGANREA